MSAAMNIITNNPYRQLGVYSNSSQKEIVANQSKVKAFLKVGRQITFPLDLNGILPPLTRTEGSIAEATAKLSLPAEQIKFAQFWFVKSTPIDDIACGKLTNGDLNAAIGIWEKKLTISSIQNIIICSLIKNELNKAISYAELLYLSAGQQKFINLIQGDSALSTTDNLSHCFLDALCEEFTPNRVCAFIQSTEWKAYVSNKVVTPLIDKISSAIDVCHSSGEGTALYDAGIKLMKDTKEDLEQLKQTVTADDLQYQMLADKLGLEILRCGIAYYNNSEEPYAAKKAMVLQKYALSIVVGNAAKNRCKENFDILSDTIAHLPPESVFDEDRAIHKELRKFLELPDKICYSVSLIESTKPHLLQIKKKLGSKNEYYLMISTLVVRNALCNLTTEVNAAQEKFSLLVSSSKVSSQKLNLSTAAQELASVIEAAWTATSALSKFDMEYDFLTNVFLPQYNTLKDIRNTVKQVSKGSTDDNIGCSIIIWIIIILFFIICSV